MVDIGLLTVWSMLQMEIRSFHHVHIGVALLRVKNWEFKVRNLDLQLNWIPAVTLICTIILSACGTNSTNTASDIELKGAVFSVHCERGWENCYSEARRRCTNGDFEELDRNVVESVAIDHHSNQSAQAHIDSMNNTITIRCK